jgi:hypothetical protein
MDSWATSHCTSLQRRRRGIFVEPQPKHNSSPVGAAYSDDVAPTELLFVFELLIYKDVSPTGFEKLNPCFIRVHLWLKNFRVVRVFRGSPHPASGHLLPIRCGEGIILWDDFLGWFVPHNPRLISVVPSGHGGLAALNG